MIELKFCPIAGAALMPVPVSGTEVGLVAALLTMLMLADFAPAERGVNVAKIVQVPLAATGDPQVLLVENDGTLAPASVTLLMLSAAVPVLVTVMCCAMLGTPMVWLPNGMLGGITEIAGAALMPVPVSGTEVGLPAALLILPN